MSPRRRQRQTSLFCDEKGNGLADKAIIVELHHALEKSGISKTGFRTKVFRRGRTQYVVRTGAEEEEIKLIGRWASKCWKPMLKKMFLVNKKM